jgi:hypothetical protein
VAAATLGWLGLEAIAWSMTRFSAATPFPGIAALLPVGGTAAVLAAGCAAPRLGPGRVLRLVAPPGRWEAVLLLVPVALAAAGLGSGSGRPPPRVGSEPELAAAGGLLALATVKLVEDPVRFSSWVRARAGRSLALGRD